MFYLSLATRQMMTVMVQHLMCIRFSAISGMKSRNDLWELGLFFEKVIVEKATLEKTEKYFLRPLDSFMNEWVVSQILVSCINTVHISVVI